MKKLFLALVLCLVSIVSFAQTEVQTQPMPQLPAQRYVTQEEFQKSLEQMNKEYKQQMDMKMDMSGYYLEKAGKLQSAAIWVSLGGTFLGTLLAASNDTSTSTIGGVITLASDITALVLQISSASNMKKSGLVLQGNGIAYKF